MKNFGLKLFSLVIAIGLSFFVNSENNSSVIRFDVPIEIRNLPADKLLVSSLTSGAQVTVRGPSYLAKDVATSNYTFKARLPSDPPARVSLRLKESDLNLPDNLQVLSIVPSDIELELDDKLVKENVPLFVPQQGRLEEGLILGGMLIEPVSVRLTGPKSEVENVERIETNAINLSALKRSGVQILSVSAPGELSQLDVEEVKVDFQITSVQEERRFENVPIELRSTIGTTYAIKPRVISLEISGPRKIVRALTKDDIIPFARLTEKLENGQTVKVSVDLPSGVELVTSDPKQVKIVGVIHSQHNASSASVPAGQADLSLKTEEERVN